MDKTLKALVEKMQVTAIGQVQAFNAYYEAYGFVGIKALADAGLTGQDLWDLFKKAEFNVETMYDLAINKLLGK